MASEPIHEGDQPGRDDHEHDHERDYDDHDDHDHEQGDRAWDDVELDADFIRAAGTQEPSARARMLAARWREGAPDPQPWRSDEPPAGWFFSKARRRRRRRR
ncbi:hypothetical protein GTW43_04245 [Streptomyces sp. SID5785]|uniref:SGM_3592 family protein n=1 Tax=Streptomyces sp. SID5785 TaxID=2690309 RepID=UPI001360E8F1|nr:hypothetical protein [Streptomyces sp. SID5785]MZD04294.1 hypothetical protein [Streptomyces sp. SID5785]